MSAPAVGRRGVRPSVRVRFVREPVADGAPDRTVDVELPGVPGVGQHVNMPERSEVVTHVYWNVDPRIPADVVAFIAPPEPADPVGDAAQVLLDRCTRRREILEYARRRDVDPCDAIVELVNHGLRTQ